MHGHEVLRMPRIGFEFLPQQTYMRRFLTRNRQ